MNYEPNTINWNVGDLVIHDADIKSADMLMIVIGKSGEDITTQYARTPHECTIYQNRREVLHDPMQFGIVAPTSRVNESESWEIYSRALNRWGVCLQLDMFIEEAAEAIQAVQHYRRGRCDMDIVCGELADLQVMLEQMKIVYGTDRFEKIFAEKISALDEKLSECEKCL